MKKFVFSHAAPSISVHRPSTTNPAPPPTRTWIAPADQAIQKRVSPHGFKDTPFPFYVSKLSIEVADTFPLYPWPTDNL